MAKEAAGITAKDFVHLHNHTHYSVLDGLTKMPDLIAKVREMGMEAVAVTDHGTMSGCLDLYKTARAAGVKPLIGFEAYVAARTMEDRDPKLDRDIFHLTLIAMNEKGYQNLCALSTEANLRGLYYKPRIDHALMEKYSDNLICLSGCAGGEISEKLKVNDYDGAVKLAEWYKGLYGDRFYLEMQDHGHKEAPQFWETQRQINDYLKKIGEELDIPLVVTCDGHYLNPGDQDVHEILLAVGTGSNLSDEKRMSMREFRLELTDPKEIIKRWAKDCPEAILNTRRIAERCEDGYIELGRILIPKFPTPNGESEAEHLNELVYRGAVRRYELGDADKMTVVQCKKKLPKEVTDRLTMEMEVISRMGYYGYFLIVQDFINWGKNQGIIFGPGRGSAAGSLVAYCLNITDLDPLEYDLLFERFLNPDRISMPDMDIDIQDTRRDEVVQYCVEKYGEARVANICTFGKMMAKNAVRDVARVMEVPYAEADRLAKLVPDPVQGHHKPLKVSLEESAELRTEYENNQTSRQVIDYASQLEGTIRSHGVHACGVVIAPDDLVKFLPLEKAQKGVVATQFPMGDVEELGLLKMDFLGLKNLTIINSALRIIRKAYGTEIDLTTLSLKDEKTYELFQRADTTGVFQLESAGMKRYLRGLKASRFEDIVAMVALYRPGPMQFIDSFIARKHGKEEISYLHPGLESSLKNTYGILVYQEQFMQISKEWCGFTGGEADTLRKAVGKKKMDLMMQMEPKFIEGAMKVGGANEELAKKFWLDLVEFANYCFNKSHAACYALIAYWTAYIKAHYPDAFMAALMTADSGDTDRLAIEIDECRQMGLEVLLPDINQSYGEFAIVPKENKIRVALSAVKGVGAGLVEELCEERKQNGGYETISDFARRMPEKFNKKAWEALIMAGAFDEFGDRSDLLFSLEGIQAYAAKLRKEAASGQVDLFGSLGGEAALPEIEIKQAPIKHDENERLKWERELIGLYISANPMSKYAEWLRDKTTPVADLLEISAGTKVTVGGILKSARAILTKKGSKMAFCQLADARGDEVELVVFPQAYEMSANKIVQDEVVLIKGNAERRSGELKILVDEVLPLDENTMANYKESPAVVMRKTAAKRGAARAPILYVKVLDSGDQEKLRELKSLCDRHAGLEEVVMVTYVDGAKKAMKLKYKVDAEAAKPALTKLLGLGNVVIK
ncbi:DNA polymerase III subunit alpha [Candidatus Saccharibacteria bacterium]|nr:DNA polymerase III subunit alpha [Candidatus Saccharibacteria bacterium]